MTSYVTPKKGFPFICYVGLVSQSTGQFQSNPTLAAGDFKISKDGGALANLATLPAVTPAASKSVKISLDSDETNADNLIVIGSDAAGAEWDDLFINIQTTVRQIDDLATPTNITAGTITTVTNLTNAPTNGDLTAAMKASINAEADTALSDYGALQPTTAGRKLDVTATGEAGIDWANIGGPTTVVNLSGTTIKTAADVETDTQDIQARLPAALSGDGFIKADMKSIDDELTSGNNATLNLKALDIRNSAGNAVNFQSTAGNFNALHLQSEGSAPVFAIENSSSGTGIDVDVATGDGVSFYGGNRGLYIEGVSGPGLYVISEQEAVYFQSTDTDHTKAALEIDGNGKGIHVVGVWESAILVESEGTNFAAVDIKKLNSEPGPSISVPQDIAVSDGDLTLANIRNGLAFDSDVQDILNEVTPLTFDSDNYVISHPMTSVVVGTNNDKSNYTLTSAYDASKTASQDSDMFDVLSFVTHLTFDSDDKVFANSAVSLTSDDIDQIVNALSFPTANENATTLLKYDWNTITGEADKSVLNALRKLRNKVSFSGGTLSIKKEDDLTNAYTQAVTQDSDQEPFKSVG